MVIEETKKSWLKLEKDFDSLSHIVFNSLFNSGSKTYEKDYARFYRRYLKLTTKVYKYLK